MEFTLPQWGQLITLIMMAFALGMDAFSLGIGLGMKGMVTQQLFAMSGAIGIMHVLMPLAGMTLGRNMNGLVGDVAVWVGGGLLCFLGGNMLWSSLREAGASTDSVTSLWGMLVSSFSVSLDSLSAGFSLGMLSTDTPLALGLMGFFGGMMGGLGMVLGKFLGSWAGNYGEALGGLILMLLGFKFLL
ncbi:Putative Mn2+ efflux pump MntP [Planifilum fulgidum]|uniref:Putative manganese efflux pump MntP n=1 Tax=Planifilum fulgidum TaxID=201973 RepID=A0A1I2LMW6_9BACL|nr:manganese efflux pump [Planifilum fulgidum]SFF79779.1 Putative Mn2+ efflux pump MntP [Planifilum fulgidum]